MQETSPQQTFMDTNSAASSRVSHFLATGFYSGKSPIMPGTAGTLASLPLFYFLQSVIPYFATSGGECFLALTVSLLGVWITAIVLRSGRYGADADDPQEIVIDEFAGLAVTLIGCPSSPSGFLLAFFLFRLFDMTKPPPIRQFEKLPGAWGIMADDVVAGVIAAALGYFISPHLGI